MTTISRYAGAAVLLFIMLMKAVSMPVALIDYAINQDYIAKTLCENRATPARHCNGKCFMKKQLARTAENEDASEQKGNGKSSLTDYNEYPAYVSFVIPAPAVNAAFSPFAGKQLPTTCSAGLLRPPIA